MLRSRAALALAAVKARMDSVKLLLFYAQIQALFLDYGSTGISYPPNAIQTGAQLSRGSSFDIVEILRLGCLFPVDFTTHWALSVSIPTAVMAIMLLIQCYFDRKSGGAKLEIGRDMCLQPHCGLLAL